MANKIDTVDVAGIAIITAIIMAGIVGATTGVVAHAEGKRVMEQQAVERGLGEYNSRKEFRWIK